MISGVPSLLAPLVWAGLLWLPGTLLLEKRPTLAELTFLPLALSPLLIGVLASVCWGLGLPLKPLLVLLSAAAAFQCVRREPEDWRPSRGQVGVLFLGLGLVVIALIPSLFQEALRLRDDARLHIPVIHSVLLTGVPPENPFLAGESLPYFWFFHVILAVVTDVTRLSADWVLSLFNGQAVVLLLWGLWRWGERLGMDARSRALTLILVAFGLSPQGWMRLLQAQAQHPDLNWNLIHASGVSALFPILSPEDPRLVATFTKVAISNALPFSLGSGVIALSFYPKRNRDWFLQTLLLLSCLGTHMAIGLLILVGRCALAFFSTLLKLASRNQLLKAVLQALLVVAIAAPYVWAVVGSRDSGALSLGFFSSRAIDLQIPLIGLWILSLPAIIHAFRHKDRKTLAVFLTLVPALA
ncbi:MAG: hypothetical protein HKN21_12870, partial [Candidatus Eisenbacteria bacterium]|nr:hypothetical protein [Candidatus Eisenbacteria bacterium]